MLNTNITQFRKNVFAMLENTIKYNEPINISTKSGNAILLSEEEYNGIMATLELSSNAELKKTLIDGMNTPLSECIPERGGLVSYKIVYSKDAVKDIQKLQRANLATKAKALIEVIRNNPYQTPPSYEKLVGDLFGMYSRRINRQHRIVYQVFEDEKIVKIIRMWTHYEK